VKKAPNRRDDRANFVEGKVSEKDQNDDGAHYLKIAELETDEGFFEGRLGQSNPLFPRRIEDDGAATSSLPCRAGSCVGCLRAERSERFHWSCWGSAVA